MEASTGYSYAVKPPAVKAQELAHDNWFTIKFQLINLTIIINIFLVKYLYSLKIFKKLEIKS